VRFAQKLGFDGFGDLKAVLKLEEGAKSYYKEDVLQDLQEFYTQTASKVFKRNFDSASRLMHEANRVFIYASGCVQSNVAQELKRLFFYDNVMIYEISGQEEFISLTSGLTADDLFIFVSLSGETPVVVEFAQRLKLLDVPFISITKLHDNTLASLSTVNLYVSPAKFQLYDNEDERIAFQSMLPYFMLVEVWYVKYRMYLQKQRDCTKVQEM
jgi:RpiR family glv operon transcriptional regulator